MLRRCVLALACLAVLKSGPVHAEAVKAEPATANGPHSAAAPSLSTEANVDANAGETLPATADVTPEAPAIATEAPTPSEPAKPAVISEPAKPAPAPEPTMKVAIDLKAQRMTVSENGTAKYTWPISSGTAEFPTPRGTFRPQWTAKMWYSKKYDNAPMPHAVFINGGVAVHATYHTRALGRPASHGCIRLAPANAAMFYKLVHRHGLKMTRVSVYGTPNYGAPAIAGRNDRARRYAARQDAGSYWGGPSYKPTAYTQGYYKPRTQRQPKIYYYADTPRAYRRYNGPRVVYQRAPRRVYYNRYGYGYDGGW